MPKGTKESPELPRPRGEEETYDLSELMGEIRLGSPWALQELMERMWAGLVRFATWEIGDLDSARDIVQDAFIYLWERRSSWVSSGSPRAYLYRIVRHQIRDEQRREKVRAKWVARERLRPPRVPATPAQLLTASGIQDAFFEAMQCLPPRRREAFDLVVLRGLSHAEAAEVLDVSKQTVANHVSMALREIRVAIGEVSEQAP